MLSDFRVAHQDALDSLLVQIVASLSAAGAVTLERVAQDGMRVRASAGAASFRHQERLEKHLELARLRWSPPEAGRKNESTRTLGPIVGNRQPGSGPLGSERHGWSGPWN